MFTVLGTGVGARRSRSVGRRRLHRRCRRQSQAGPAPQRPWSTSIGRRRPRATRHLVCGTCSGCWPRAQPITLLTTALPTGARGARPGSTASGPRRTCPSISDFWQQSNENAGARLGRRLACRQSSCQRIAVWRSPCRARPPGSPRWPEPGHVDVPTRTGQWLRRILRSGDNAEHLRQHGPWAARGCGLINPMRPTRPAPGAVAFRFGARCHPGCARGPPRAFAPASCISSGRRRTPGDRARRRGLRCVIARDQPVSRGRA